VLPGLRQEAAEPIDELFRGMMMARLAAVSLQ
jgi:hypothetical protein